MKKVSPWLFLALLLTVSFTLATSLELRDLRRNEGTPSANVFKLLLGDGRRMFANQFLVQADVYFHSGYYPSIFDRREQPKPVAITGNDGDEDHDQHQHDAQGRCLHGEPDDHSQHQHDEHGHCTHDEGGESAHEKEMSFLGEPKDWIERFGRRFRITEHTHLENGKEREILPWLKLAAELDPQKIETYTVAAYWLRKRLGKVDEAEAFLREGVRNNTNSCEILFELGQLYYENRHDTNRARNLWIAALDRWDRQTPEAKTNNLLPFGQITVNLARLEENAGNLPAAVTNLEMAKVVSRHPEALQKKIEELRAKISGLK